MDRYYESMLILKPDLSEEDQEEVFGKFTKKITDLKGEVEATKVWAKNRNFYYFLKSRGAEKKKYYKGMYWLVYFRLSTGGLPQLRELVRLEERILRSVIINRAPPKLTKQQP